MPEESIKIFDGRYGGPVYVSAATLASCSSPGESRLNPCDWKSIRRPSGWLGSTPTWSDWSCRKACGTSRGRRRGQARGHKDVLLSPTCLAARLAERRRSEERGV